MSKTDRQARILRFDEIISPFGVRLRSFGIAELSPRSWDMSASVSRFWTLYRNDRDGAWIDVDGQRTELHRTTTVLIPPGMAFDSGCEKRLRHLYVYFTVDGIDSAAVRRCIPQPLRIGSEGSFLDEALRCAAPKLASADQARLIALVASALAPALDQHAKVFDRGDPVVAPALVAIERDYPRTLAVADLAKACGLAVETFARRFRRATGRTPIQWLRTHRVRVASHLLLTTDWPLDRIAAAVGCGSRAYLSRMFISCIGMGPSEFRRGRLHGTALPGLVRIPR